MAKVPLSQARFFKARAQREALVYNELEFYYGTACKHVQQIFIYSVNHCSLVIAAKLSGDKPKCWKKWSDLIMEVEKH